jgi:hypothetical protein
VRETHSPDKDKVGAAWGFIAIASRPFAMDVGGFSNANTAEHIGGMTTSARYKMGRESKATIDDRDLGRVT